MNILYAALGSAMGGALRYWLTGIIQKNVSVIFPFGTLTVNIIGSFILGIVMFYLDTRELVNPQLKIFLTVGICGGLTTFSTFSYETLSMIQQSEFTNALLNTLLNLVLTLAAVFAAYFINRIIPG